jgi:hypothetical protein
MYNNATFKPMIIAIAAAGLVAGLAVFFTSVAPVAKAEAAVKTVLPQPVSKVIAFLCSQQGRGVRRELGRTTIGVVN